MVLPTDVSSTRKIVQVCAAVFFCLTSAGVIFGYAALKPVLIRHGVYSELCTDDEKEADVWVCAAQDLKLNFMFTLSAVITNTAALPIGVLLDWIGPRYTSLIGAVAFGLGNFIFGLGIEHDSVDTYYIGFIFLALGGPLIFLSSFHLSNTFPVHSGLILSFVTGSFDASSIPYLVYNWIDKSYGPVHLKTFFWGYITIPVLLIIYQLVIAPKESYERPPIKTRVASTGEAEPEVEEGNGDRTIGIMFGKTLGRQLASNWWLFISLFLCVYMTRINFYIQNVSTQLLFYLDHPKDAHALATAFTILLPFGGIIGIGPVGMLLDRGGILVTSNVVLAAGVLYGLLGITSSYVLQLLSIAIFVLLRPLMYTFVGDYCAKVFGFHTFGTVYGLSNSLSGIFGLVLRPMDLLIKGPLQGNYTPMNLTLMSFGFVASGLLSLKVYASSRRIMLE